MTNVLFADRDGSAFGELGTRTVPALLPLQAVPALERTLQSLVAAGRRSALLVVGPRSTEIQKRFGKGIRWGIALEYVKREEGESCGDVLRRVEPRLDGDVLVVRADVGCHALVKPFLDAVERRDEPIVAATVGGRLAGLWRIASGSVKKAELPREPGSAEWVPGPDHTPLPLDSEVRPIDSLAVYRAADRAEKPAVSDRADVDPKKTKLGPGTTVAEEAVVLPGADLEEVTVLTRTVVPGGLKLRDAIVSGNLVLDAKTGQTSWLSDQLPPPSGKSVSTSSRLAGLVALVLSLPLWPVAFLWSLIANAGHATRPVTLNGNGSGKNADGTLRREPFETFRFETGVPVFRDLPLLRSVASGRLALVGVAALSPQEEAALKEPWERARLEAPAALLSSARLVVPAGSPPEVARLVDAFTARAGSPGVLGHALFLFTTAKAWTAQKEWNPDTLPDTA